MTEHPARTDHGRLRIRKEHLIMYLLQPVTSPVAGDRGAHRLNAAQARAATAFSRLSTAVNLRPILRRAALAAAGTGAAAALALGSSAPSFAAAIPVVNTNNQAGYVAGNGSWNLRFVQTVVTLPSPTSPQYGCPFTSSPNYLESSLQLIGLPPGLNAAIGVTCRFFPFPDNFYSYRLGWALGYAGSTDPALDNIVPLPLNAGDRILLQLYYSQGHPGQGDQTVKFTACYAVGSPAHCEFPTPEVNFIKSVPVTLYKFAVVSANVANPMPHPPATGTSQILMSFTDAAVTSYNGTHGTGINGPWSVRRQDETETAVGGNLVAAPTGLTTVQPPPPQNATSTFDIKIFGKPGIGP
jgi:hypothetical protein